ncbi:uncharacterized protein CTRU02_208852 [Colletotrichum truncatum]|uniref:Uncharacterized protein n=1 Tax=Colletotrichum truncatum TaxID=5467 RepID=A0ACC3YXT9_COLTU|nr:uncharacterized protein CTRU02_06487 [Colletotrichum truncatum]KAF6792404.1 hypothetical protein CTRU02_06487 [Colletotrichum truncatum]
MPKHTVIGQDLVPMKVWFMVGGNIMSPPPTWDCLVAMTEERNKTRQAIKDDVLEFRAETMQAKEKLECAKKLYKETNKGGIAAWKQRKRDSCLNKTGDDRCGGKDRRNKPVGSRTTEPWASS